MIDQLITSEGFMNIETFCKIAGCVFLATIVGVPSASLFLFPSIAMVGISGVFNACMHCFFKKNDALKTSVMNSESVKGFNMESVDETRVMRFLGQVSRLCTPKGKFFGYGKEPTVADQASSVLSGRFFGDGGGQKCGCSYFGGCRH